MANTLEIRTSRRRPTTPPSPPTLIVQPRHRRPPIGRHRLSRQSPASLVLGAHTRTAKEVEVRIEVPSIVKTSEARMCPDSRRGLTSRLRSRQEGVGGTRAGTGAGVRAAAAAAAAHHWTAGRKVEFHWTAASSSAPLSQSPAATAVGAETRSRWVRRWFAVWRQARLVSSNSGRRLNPKP